MQFAEPNILAEIVAQQAAPALRTPPLVREGLGNMAILYEALLARAIDIYAEYTGTIAVIILRSSGSLALADMDRPRRGRMA